jgi:hypothetical protein
MERINMEEGVKIQVQVVGLTLRVAEQELQTLSYYLTLSLVFDKAGMVDKIGRTHKAQKAS